MRDREKRKKRKGGSNTVCVCSKKDLGQLAPRAKRGGDGLSYASLSPSFFSHRGRHLMRFCMLLLLQMHSAAINSQSVRRMSPVLKDLSHTHTHTLRGAQGLYEKAKFCPPALRAASACCRRRRRHRTVFCVQHVVLPLFGFSSSFLSTILLTLYTQSIQIPSGQFITTYLQQQQPPPPPKPVRKASVSLKISQARDPHLNCTLLAASPFILPASPRLARTQHHTLCIVAPDTGQQGCCCCC